MAEIKDYSVTADDNDSASPNGMPEGMAPSGVNNSWRESFARVKRWYEDIQGAKTTTGSSNAYVLAAARVVTAYAAGDAYLFKANHTCTSAGSTLNVDSVGAKSIVTSTGAALGAGAITSGGLYMVVFEATADKFMLIAGSAGGSADNILIYNSSPTFTMENSTSEDTAGGRESNFVVKGLQSGSEESTLAKIEVSHDGSSDDQKGRILIYTNDGSDDAAPTQRLKIDSAGLVTVAGGLDIDGAVQIDSTVTVGVDDTGYDVKFFGATSGKSLLWDESADSLIVTGSTSQQGTLTVGVDDTGYDVKFFGATAGKYALWDESADSWIISGTQSTVTLGTSNYIAGVNAGNTIESGGNYNVVVGDEAGTAITTGGHNVAVGYAALDAASTASSNTAVGSTALGANLAGASGTAVGYAALTLNTTGSSNVAVGYNALGANVDGANNTAVGTTALDANTSASNSTAVGYGALGANTTGGYNEAFGYGALDANTTGAHNVGLGLDALGANTEGTYNVTVGNYSLDANTDGVNNTSVGSYSLSGNTEGDYNVASGYGALLVNTTGSGNTAAGYYAFVGVTTGTYNTSIGYSAGSVLIDGTNNTMIGNSAQAAATGTSNSVTLGNSSIDSLRCQVDITVLSDKRDKEDIEDLSVGLDFINTLRPVKFTWNMRDGGKVGIKEAGFIAQDLDASQQEFDAEEYLQLVLKENPEKLEATPARLLPILVKAVQELSAEVKELKEKVNA